jgi:biotin carboxyl carrier protein
VRTEDGRSIEVSVQGDPAVGPVQVSVDGRAYELDARRLSGGVWSLLSDGAAAEVRVARAGSGWVAHHTGGRIAAEVLDAGRAALLGGVDGLGDGARAVKSPMPGRIVQLLVAQGDSVDKGASLVVVEAMKMENVLTASAAGEVTVVHVAAGDAVEAGQDLLVIE